MINFLMQACQGDGRANIIYQPKGCNSNKLRDGKLV
uniref:Uncharacterized protein n=1 Tax=Rhizophora mucronata TaxID=61149 RepID=A0A2P2NPM2_RHIMU